MGLDYVESLGDGVYVVDTGLIRPRFDAAFLIVERGRAAFVDTGSNHAVPRLLAALAETGLSPACVEYVIPTHMHLDHAGGMGLLMQSLPNATVLVHPRGARHAIDPSALYRGALAIYGPEVMASTYGVPCAVDAERVRSTQEGMTIDLGGRALRFMDTPGHARHHHCIWDERTRGWFSGDTFGTSYREFDTARGPWIIPAATPVQFDPEAMQASVRRLLQAGPVCMYMTHFGRLGEVGLLAESLARQIDDMVALALALPPTATTVDALKSGLAALYRRSLHEHGVLDLDEGIRTLSLDIELNALGLAHWLGERAA